MGALAQAHAYLSLTNLYLMLDIHSLSLLNSCSIDCFQTNLEGPDVNHSVTQGAQWLSGRVLDSRPKGRGFEPHRRHCVVVLEQDTFILA